MIENPALTDFPVRPPIAVGESLDGWCWRIYVSNGHAVPQEARSSLREKRAVRQLSTSSSLSNLLGVDLLKKIEAKEEELLERWDPAYSLQWHAWSKTIRICPTCIRSTRYHQLIWQMPLVNACAVHACCLTDCCPKCGHNFNWWTLCYGWQCPCGTQVGELLTASAPRWQVTLVRMLARAVDAQVTDEVRAISFGTISDAPPYRTRDLYGMLWWCLKLRRAMTESEHRFYNLAKSWPVVKRRGARMEPRAWELSLVNGNSKTCTDKGRWMFNWYLRSRADSHTHIKVTGFQRPMPVVLIGPENWKSFQRLIALVQELDGDANPLAATVLVALEHAIREHSAGIPGLPMVFFHPKLSLEQRQEHIKELTHWWTAFAQNVPTVASEDLLLYEPDVTEPNQFWSDYHQAAGVPLLNILFSAARLQFPPEHLGVLARRWHLPAELRKPKDIMLEVGGYVGNLFEEELNFVYALLNVTIHRLPALSSTVDRDE